MTELISLTYKNGSDENRCLYEMKGIALPKPNPDMGNNRVTLSKALVDAKLFECKICEYVNRLTITKNGPKATYSLRWGKFRKPKIRKIQFLLGL